MSNSGNITPYCHCKEPLKVKHYKLGGVLYKLDNNIYVSDHPDKMGFVREID